jgi:hypothetical protein
MARINRQLCSQSPNGLSALDLRCTKYWLQMPVTLTFSYSSCFLSFFPRAMFGVLSYCQGVDWFFLVIFLFEFVHVLLAG